MSRLIDEKLRRQVAARADELCEYCLVHEEDGFFEFHVDHIISRKHGGETVLTNLALACPFCNWHKGSDVGGISQTTGELIRFFNPRSESWSSHFRLIDGMIDPITEAGEITVRILNFNHPDRLAERRALASAGRYPTMQALARLRA